MIGTLNVRTLRTEDRLCELEEALLETNIDILGLAEVRRNSEKIIYRKSDFIFYHFGETQGHKGVGFIIRKHLKAKIIELKGFSERIAVLRLRVGSSKTLNIYQVYSPTAESDVIDREIFYESLTTILSRDKNNNWKNSTIILGDFNAQVGGKYGYGRRNEAGQMLVDFCFQQGLKVINTFF